MSTMQYKENDYIELKINETLCHFPHGTTLDDIRKSVYPRAQVYIVNGQITEPEYCVKENDIIELCEKGCPPPENVFRTLYAARHGREMEQKLFNAHIGIAGAGGIGAYTARALARAGCGHITLVDKDIVTPSNLHRQSYECADIGEYKVHALASILKRINPYSAIDAHVATLTLDNAASFFSETDICIEALDNAAVKKEFIETILCTTTRPIVIGVSGVGGIACTKDIAMREINSRFYIVGDETSDVADAGSLFATRVGTAAFMMAHLAVRIICGV